ncbi:MAG: hypothetical protein GX957_05570 [Clostridiaceae bacterium]|nr:hypothetical protein [Clostridiaceae bacterium]
MLDVDLERFWEDDALAHLDNCFNPDAPQVALGITMSEECVFAELGEPGNPWGPIPRERRIELNKRYNDKAEKIVGKRLLNEDIPEEDEIFPAYRQIGEVFGGKYVFDGNVEWLMESCSTPQELEKILDRIDRMDIRSFILPENWESEKKRIFEKCGRKPSLYTRVRGPVTLATSIYGIENLIFLMYDEPELAKRFFQTIKNVILEYIKIFIIEAGYTLNDFPRGFGFYDDNCYLLTADLYEEFAFPVLKEVFEFTSPEPTDNRFQHSDSEMRHLLPILAKLNLTGCNFGPTLTVSEIRQTMPNTRIDGQIAPFTFMSNDIEKIMEEARRDCKMAIEGKFKGLNLRTAGSINNGSLLTSMRAVMYVIQNEGRY